MTREEIELVCDDEIIFYDGFDEAIVGLGTRFGITEPVVVYDKNKIIDILKEDMEVNDDDLSDGLIIDDVKYEMALEYFEYNVIGGWVGERTPIFIEMII